MHFISSSNKKNKDKQKHLREKEKCFGKFRN